MPYIQKLTEIKRYPFDFSSYFDPSATISSGGVSVTVTPSGPTEVTALREISGQQVTISVDGGACTASTVYTIGCTAIDSAGNRQSIDYDILMIADPAGSVAVPPTLSAGLYTSILSQAGTAAPTASMSKSSLIAGTPVHTRTAVGTFRATLTAAFPAGKTQVTVTVSKGLVGNESDGDGVRISDDVVEWYVRDFAGNLVDGFNGLAFTIQTFN